MKLCLGIIATNEEYVLEKFLPDLSVAFGGEVVAIDYGSTDRTREIFDKYCKRVMTTTWTRNFGEAKTNLIKLAEGCGYGWIFLLDADEMIDLHYVSLIWECIEKNQYDVYYLPRFSYISPGILDGEIDHFPDLQARLFKLNVGYHYRNVRHCILCKGDDTACAWELKYGAVIPVTIFHYKGYKSEDDRKLSAADREAAVAGLPPVTNINQVKEVDMEKTNRPLKINIPL